MEALPRSEISFRRSGSSGLVWDDKLLSGELQQVKPKDDHDHDQTHKTDQHKPEPKPYKSVEVESTIDPPSPKVSGCCALFGKPVKTTNNKHKSKPTHKSS